ncbi:MAG TPA: hypothetical protein VHN37_15150 [Actinomycetota bacterium]|nr:hypothetical protein [Actinomycetota bacterium]
MAEFVWKLHGPSGEDLRATEPFASKDEAEAWMGAEWASLLDEGAETVSLVRDGDVLYRMGLREG